MFGNSVESGKVTALKDGYVIITENSPRLLIMIVRIHFLNSNTKMKVLSFESRLHNNNNKKRSHTQFDSRKQVIAFQDRVMTISIKEAQHPLK